jgi:exonuclease SbcC
MRARLRIKNMSGVTTDRTGEILEDMVVYTGPNGSGKSTRLKAIQLALLGYIPGGPRTARDIMHYATAKEMAVGFEIPFLRVDRFISGTTNSASIKTSVGPDEGNFKDEEATEKDKQAKILADLGGGPYAMDLGAFVEMNENQQRAFILDLCASPDEGDPLQAIRDRLTEKGVGPETRPMMKAFAAIEGTPDNLPQALLQLTGILRSQKLELENSIKKAKGTAQDMVRDRTSHNTSGASIAETKEEIEKAQKDLEEIAAEKGKLFAAGYANEATASQLKAIEDAIAAKWRSTSSTMDAEQTAAAQAEANEQEKVWAERLKEIEEAIVELEAAIDAARAEQASADKESNLAQQRIRNAQRRADLLQEGKCPLNLECNHPPEAFQEALQAALKSVGYFGKGKAQAEAAASEATKKVLELTKQRSAAQKRLMEIPGLIATAQAKARNAARHLQVLKEIAELEKTRETLKSHEAEAVVTADEEVLAAKEEGVRSRLAELKKLLEEKELQKAAEIAFTRALQDRQEREEDLAIVKAAVDIVGPKGMQAEAAKVAAGPFLSAVNLTLRRFALKAYVETERGGKPIFEWGLEHLQHGKRRWEVLPTSYRAIMGAAVALAFFGLRASRKAILIVDDLEHLDERNRTRFFEAVAAAIKDKVLDLFVGAQTLPQKAGKILKVINLQPATDDGTHPETQAA